MSEQLIIKTDFPPFEEVQASDWYKSKSELVRQLIDMCPPTQYYRIRSTGRKCVLYSYGEPESQKVEDATFTLKTIDGFLGLNHVVFGLKFGVDFEAWKEGDENRPPEPKPFPCGDCGIDTHIPVDGTVKNDYIVHNSLWNKYGNGDGHLCWDCFEKRLGRPITGKDLSLCLINTTINTHTMKLLADSMK